MLGNFGARHIDVLSEFHEGLRGYVESGKRLEEYLAPFGQFPLLRTPRYVIQLIEDHYRYGTLYLRDFIPTPCVRGPEMRYSRVKEAEQCVTDALALVYGIKVAPPKREGITFVLGGAHETEDETAVKRELRWVFMAGAIRKEIGQIKDKCRALVSDKAAFPALNAYFNVNVFDRRFRPVVVALELEALPGERAVDRVEHFLHTLYRKADETLVAVSIKAPEKQ